ncbi:MAG: DivIVA domain-containing protein [Actinomycetota bacterium]
MKKDKEAGDAQDFTGMPASTVVTSADIQSKEFNVSRFGGYRMRDVDEFLDQITESMTKLGEENERLRSAAGLPVAPSIGAPDLVDTSRQADEIIERARAEAAKIVQDARGQAVPSGATGAGTDAGRAAVAPFLSQERDFLQQLATLVQGHAESVKGMAKASRSKPPAAASPPAAPTLGTSPPAPPAPEPPSVSPAPAPESPRTGKSEAKVPASEATQPMPAVRPSPEPPESSGRDTKPPIRVEEPATASVGAAGESDDESGQNEGGDRSLRELFWGEE